MQCTIDCCVGAQIKMLARLEDECSEIKFGKISIRKSDASSDLVY
jgi:hypothetical protein